MTCNLSLLEISRTLKKYVLRKYPNYSNVGGLERMSRGRRSLGSIQVQRVTRRQKRDQTVGSSGLWRTRDRIEFYFVSYQEIVSLEHGDTSASFYKIISTTLSPNLLSPSTPAQSLLASVFRGFATKNWDFHKGDTLFEAVQHERTILQSASVSLMKSFCP